MVFEGICNPVSCDERFHALRSQIAQEIMPSKLSFAGSCGLESKSYDRVQWSTGRKIPPLLDDADYGRPPFNVEKVSEEIRSYSVEDSETEILYLSQKQLSWQNDVSYEALQSIIENQIYDEDEEDDSSDEDESEDENEEKEDDHDSADEQVESLSDHEDALADDIEDILRRLQGFDIFCLDESVSRYYSAVEEDLDDADDREDEDGRIVESRQERYSEVCEEQYTYIAESGYENSDDGDASITHSDYEAADDDDGDDDDEYEDVPDEEDREYGEDGEYDEDEDEDEDDGDDEYTDYEEDDEVYTESEYSADDDDENENED